MKLKPLFTIYGLLVMVACFTACKKDRPTGPGNLLAGDWREISATEPYVSLKFSHNAFWLSTIVAGTTTRYSGAYLTNGNNLKLNAAEVSVQEPGKPVHTSVIKDEVFPGATFMINGDTLTLNYQSYSAVRPKVANTIQFKRMLTID